MTSPEENEEFKLLNWNDFASLDNFKVAILQVSETADGDVPYGVPVMSFLHHRIGDEPDNDSEEIVETRTDFILYPGELVQLTMCLQRFAYEVMRHPLVRNWIHKMSNDQECTCDEVTHHLNPEEISKSLRTELTPDLTEIFELALSLSDSVDLAARKEALKQVIEKLNRQYLLIPKDRVVGL